MINALQQYYITGVDHNIAFLISTLKNNDFLWLLILGTICTAYAFVVSVDVMKHLSPYSLMLSINMEPIYGILLASLFLNESKNMSYQFYVGFSFIFLAVILNGILKIRQK